VQRLVGLNFRQEAREADLRYGLVRVRENAESIAFYRGADSEVGLLVGRLGRVVANYTDLLKASRNLDVFQSAYRYIIILLPAAVVAPLFFRGEIEFGVVNQSQSAFSHILSDGALRMCAASTCRGCSYGTCGVRAAHKVGQPAGGCLRMPQLHVLLKPYLQETNQ
jgi:ABC-type uncharacterized transport system fused permease/ATPase subunit